MRALTLGITAGLCCIVAVSRRARLPRAAVQLIVPCCHTRCTAPPPPAHLTATPACHPALQFAAAGTAIGVSLEDSSARSRSLPPWVDSVVLAAGAVSALCAAAAICCQAARCCARPKAGSCKALTAAAVLSTIGLLAQAAMLTCVTGEHGGRVLACLLLVWPHLLQVTAARQHN